MIENGYATKDNLMPYITVIARDSNHVNITIPTNDRYTTGEKLYYRGCEMTVLRPSVRRDGHPHPAG
jgi:hypothetical protein